MAYTSSRRQQESFTGVIVFILVIFLVIGIELRLHKSLDKYGLLLGLAILALVVTKIILRINGKRLLSKRLATLEFVDGLNGLQFEQYVANLLKRHGFSKIKLTEKYDMGVDIIAEKNGECWGIQTKRYSGLVKASAVRQVVAGLSSYNCNKAMVITNSTFSKYAIKLARSNHCILIDRIELAKLIAENR